MDSDEAANQLHQSVMKWMESKKSISVTEDFIERLVEFPQQSYERGEISKQKAAILSLCMENSTKQERRNLKKYLLSQFNITLSKSTVIDISEKHNWKVRERLLEKSYYWDRLQKLWENERTFPYKVITGIDDDTNDTLERVGDPSITTPWFFRGLVMGSVQSGKTTNFSALISKAIDLGYGHVVVLAGLTNSLRAQTQERIDTTIIGRNSVFAGQSLYDENYPIVRYSSRPLRFPISKTSTNHDFSTNHGSEVEDALSEATIYVVKKNLNVLTLLADYFTRLQPLGKLKKPLLLIDDEADSASVNTKKTATEMTPINNEIRKILASAERKSYIGYTATPFANIFIDPNYQSPSEMISNDLFPKHFIKSLGWPDNYVGAHNLFGDDDVNLKNKNIINIEDYEYDYLPPERKSYSAILKAIHKKDILLEELPWALEEAIICFILVSSIYEEPDRIHKHTSMLINVSRFNLVQETIHRLTKELITTIFIAANSDIQKKDWHNNSILSRIRDVWDRHEFAKDSNLHFDAIRLRLVDAVRSVNPIVINTLGDKLYYPDEKPSEKGKRYIAIGGLALSRGLTLEGLAISYVVRNIGAKDTLLQTARWFGYRDGYKNLCRVFLTEKLVEDFVDANDTLIDLRRSLSDMALAGKTPDDFGLRVMQSEQGLAITARQKMWTAQPYISLPNLALRHFQIHELYNDSICLTKNEISLRRFLDSSLTKTTLAPTISKPSPEASNAIFYTSDCLNEVIELLDSFESPMSEMQSNKNTGQHSAVVDYILDRAGEMKSWDIAIPYRVAGTSKLLLDKEVVGNSLGFKVLNDLFKNKNQEPRVRYRSNMRLTGLDDSILEFTSRSLADSPKSDLVHGFPPSIVLNELNLIEATKGSRGTESTAAQILKRRERPILLLHLIEYSAGAREGRIKDAKQIKFGPTGLVISITIGFPGTAMPLKPRKYLANIRAQEIRRRTFLEETDEAFEEGDAI